MRHHNRPVRWTTALAATALVLLGACGSDDGTASPSTSATISTTSASGTDGAAQAANGDVTVQAATGEVTVPVTDENIWALDYGIGLTLLAVGIVPEHAARTHDTLQSREDLLAAAGSEIVEADRPELVAAAAPALIVGVDHPDHRILLNQLEAIAPVVLLDDGLSYDDQLDLIGQITGRSAQADALTARADAALDDLATRIDDAGLAGATVSVLQDSPPVFFAYDNSTQFGPILARVGLDRPAPQAGESDWGFIELSEEDLDEHGADIMLALIDDSYSPDSVLGNPLLDTTDAITADVQFVGWYSSDLLGFWWVVHDLDAVLIDGEPPATDADVPDLWALATGAE